MNLNTLHDAFATLEERADALPATPPEFAVSVSPTRPGATRSGLTGSGLTRSGLTRFAAPAAAAAAVVSVAAGVTVWQSGQHSHSGGPAPQSAAHRPSSSVPAPSVPAPSPTHRRSDGRYVPPSTAAELAAKTRTVLGSLATIKIDATRSSDCGAGTTSQPPAITRTRRSSTTLPPLVLKTQGGCSGAAIGGSLTSGGQTGGFDLDVYTTTRGDKAFCDDGDHCSIHTRSNGATLAVSTWNDPNLPGGVTYEVDYVRPDGGVILVHLSTERDPKGKGPITASHMPLTTQQLTTFATSSQW